MADSMQHSRWQQALSLAGGLLERAYDRTRLTTWPQGEPLRIAVVAPQGAADHVALALDALATFHPGSAVTIFTEQPAAEQVRLAPAAPAPATAEPQLREIAFRPLVKPASGEPFDVLLQLHPWPYVDAARLAASRRVQPFLRCIRASRRWVLFRNLSLWDGSWSGRTTRRILNALRGPLRGWLDRAETQRLNLVLGQYQSQGRQWIADAPCRHDRAFLFSSRPRRILFCPACGMGLTPPALAPSPQALAQLYGPSYALSFNYVGQREWRRTVQEDLARMEAALAALGFDAIAPAPGPLSVLDYGCGSGRFAPLWERRGWEYLGIDSSPASIAFARRHMPQPIGGPRREFIEGDLNTLLTRHPGPYGCIFLSHVLEHIPEPVELLAALRRCTLPGGALCISVPDAWHYTWNPTHRGYRNAEHLWDFTPEMLAATIRAAGWAEVHLHPDPDPQQHPYQSALAINI